LRLTVETVIEVLDEPVEGEHWRTLRTVTEVEDPANRDAQVENFERPSKDDSRVTTRNRASCVASSPSAGTIKRRRARL
jgi:hypothetical protein